MVGNGFVSVVKCQLYKVYIGLIAKGPPFSRVFPGIFPRNFHVFAPLRKARKAQEKLANDFKTAKEAQDTGGNPTSCPKQWGPMGSFGGTEMEQGGMERGENGWKVSLGSDVHMFVSCFFVFFWFLWSRNASCHCGGEEPAS